MKSLTLIMSPGRIHILCPENQLMNLWQFISGSHDCNKTLRNDVSDYEKQGKSFHDKYTIPRVLLFL